MPTLLGIVVREAHVVTGSACPGIIGRSIGRGSARLKTVRESPAENPPLQNAIVRN
jgi:hypothetical protein